MKKLKLFSALLAGLTLVSALTACGSKTEEIPNKLRIGMECAYAPFNWTQLEETEYTIPLADGTFADGYDVQIAKLIGEKLGCEIEIEKIDWDGLAPSITSRKIDLIIAGMTDDADRRKTIDFTDIYYTSDVVVVLRKDSPFAGATSLEDLRGATITAQSGTNHYALIDKIPGAVKKEAMMDFPTMLMATQSGKIDGYIAERPTALAVVLTNPDITFISFDKDKGFGEEVPISIGLRKRSNELKAKLNDVLSSLSLDQREELMRGAVERQSAAIG